MLTVMREGFDSLNQTLSATSTKTASAIAEAFEMFKGELEIAPKKGSVLESVGTQDHKVGEPPAKKRCEQLPEKSDEEILEKSPEIEMLINRAPHASNEGKSGVLKSLKQRSLERRNEC